MASATSTISCCNSTPCTKPVSYSLDEQSALLPDEPLLPQEVSGMSTTQSGLVLKMFNGPVAPEEPLRGLPEGPSRLMELEQECSESVLCEVPLPDLRRNSKASLAHDRQVELLTTINH
jgi:hypothetical protein